MILKNGWVFYGGKFSIMDIAVADNKITAVSLNEQGDGVVDCSGKYVIPGLIDLHTHGCMGCDFADANEGQIDEMLDFYVKNGTTSLLATIISLPKEDYFKQLSILRKYGKDSPVKGLHLEGPFLAQGKRGAHNPSNICGVDVGFAARLWEQSGFGISIMTAAPELENIKELAQFAENKFALSIGHTMCDYEGARAALKGGFTRCTHMFNAMPQLHHREPGAVAACLESEAVKELICDGVHINDGLIRAMLKGYGSEIALISDSISPCGLGDGRYTLGGLTVRVENRRATLENGTIAGSCATLLECMRHAIEIGCRINTVVACATEIPAKALGEEARVGKIEAGYAADLLVLSQSFDLIRVYRGGVQML